MTENYLTGRGPTVKCEYCNAQFHAEATGCPNPRCGANAGAQEFKSYRDSRDVAGMDFVRGMRGPFGAGGM